MVKKKTKVAPRSRKSKPKPKPKVKVRKTRAVKKPAAKKVPGKVRAASARPAKARAVKAPAAESTARRATEIATELMATLSAEVAAQAAPANLGLTSPVPVAWLADEAGRELALDSLAAWVVSTLQAAQDDASARQTLRVAIETFYDIREAAQQPRGEYAGHFFIVDAVGLGESNRPVPWQVLAETVSQDRLDRFSALFEEAVREVS